MTTSKTESLADRALTTVCNDGSFRVIALRSTQTVQQVVDWQGAKGQSAANLAELVTAAVLLRLTMAPWLRVQCIVRGRDGRGTLVADSHPDGSVRGLLRETAGPVEVGPGSLVQFMRFMPNGALQQGVVEVRRDFGIAGAIGTYLRESEQVTSIVGTGCVLDPQARVSVAGGWIVQLMPECTSPPLSVMTERMNADFSDARRVLTQLSGDPARIQSEILYGMDYTQTADATFAARCPCSRERVLASMASLGHDELTDIVQKGETLDITCDYCQRRYHLAPESLRGLLHAS